MRAIDVFHQGLEHVICAWQVDDVHRRPRPGVDLGHPARRARRRGAARPAADAHPLRPRRRGGRARAITGRTSRCGSTSAVHATSPTRRAWSPPPSASTARSSTDSGARSCRSPEKNLHVLQRRREPGRLGRRLHARPRVASRLLPPCGLRLGVRRRHRGRAPAAGRAAAGADAAAGFRPRGLAASIDTIEAWEPQTLAITHFGDYRDVAEHSTACARRSRAGASWPGAPTATATRRRCAPSSPPPRRRDAASFAQAMPPEDQWLGIDRYRKGRARLARAAEPSYPASV